MANPISQGDESLVSKLAKVYIKQLQEVEDTRNQVYLKRMLDNAVGVQLDGIGDIIGEPRNGRGDADYRNAIILQIYINNKYGEPETLISAVREYTDASDIIYKELYPAKVYINFTSDTIPDGLFNQIQGICPAGVGLTLTASPTDDPFIFSQVGTIVPDWQGKGFSDVNQLTGGKLTKTVI